MINEIEVKFNFVCTLVLMEKVKYQNKTIGVNFTDYKGSLYCVINYNKKNTKFPYLFNNLNDNDIERYHIALVAKFCFKNLNGFVINDFKDILNRLLLSNISSSVTKRLNLFIGDALTYNQFTRLMQHADSGFVLSPLLRDILFQKKSIIDETFEAMYTINQNFITSLKNDIQKDILLYCLLTNYELEYRFRVIELFDNSKKTIEKMFQYYIENIESKTKDIFSVKLEKAYLENKINDYYYSILSKTIQRYKLLKSPIL